VKRIWKILSVNYIFSCEWDFDIFSFLCCLFQEKYCENITDFISEMRFIRERPDVIRLHGRHQISASALNVPFHSFVLFLSLYIYIFLTFVQLSSTFFFIPNSWSSLVFSCAVFVTVLLTSYYSVTFSIKTPELTHIHSYSLHICVFH
jgi:hypothetical protein